MNAVLRDRWIGALAALTLAATLAAASRAEVSAPPAVAAPAETAALLPYVGEYEKDGVFVTVLEDGGRLFALGAGQPGAGARPIDVGTQFEHARGSPARLRIDGTTFQRSDIGARRIAQIRAGLRLGAERLRAAALAAEPPHEPPARRKSDLVDLTTIDPTIRLDIRYASSNNFMGMPLYETPMAFLQRPAAEALGRANHTLAAYGYGLLIHDGYRPWYVTKMFWDATMPEAHVFVADPAQGSRHNRGCAVDLTLYDLKTGQAVEMTGRYDEMSPRSYADYPGGTTRQRWLRRLLRQAMEAQGFDVYPEEWWHFDYRGWADYAIGNARFADLGANLNAPASN